MYSRRWTLSSGELVITRPKTHGDVLLGLWKSAADGRLPHALLFSGPSGVGKFLSAGWFAAGLLCARGPGEPCLTCGPCKRVRSGSHPDLFVVDAAASGQDQLTIAFITPCVALLVGQIFGEEQFTAYTLLGTAMILFGVGLGIRRRR